jgi:hypothetical protein
MTPHNLPTVIAGPHEARVPVIPLGQAQCSPKRDGRNKPGRDAE